MQNLIKNLNTDWKDTLDKIPSHNIDQFLTNEKQKYTELLEIYPPNHLIFNAFNHFDFNQLKVVILGMDPYINKDEAMGLAFSVPDHIKLPPSLKNIYKEIHTDIGTDMSKRNGNLIHWARQGVLLLNSALTVLQSKSGSHSKIWRDYTNNIISIISKESNTPIIFVLWGNHAKEKKILIDTDKHYILESAHPSPLSAKKFMGNKHFSKINQILHQIGKKQINW